MAQAKVRNHPIVPELLPVPETALAHHLHALGPAMTDWRENLRIPPALLITGQRGLGKRTMAYFLAQWIFCEKTGFSEKNQAVREADLLGGGLFGASDTSAPEETTPSTRGNPHSLLPCGECIQCKRAINGSWVDFTEIRSLNGDEDGSSSSTLKIEQFRKIKESLGFGAHEGNYRIFLITDADRMTSQAANSVLKLLEEPPPGWIFFLTATDPSLVLATVLSRCQSIKLRPFSVDTLRKLLSDAGILGEKQRLGATLAGGSWGRALELASEEISENRQLIFDFLERPQAVLSPLVDWASQSDHNFGLLCDQLELICLDLIRWSISEQLPAAYAWENFDGAMALQSHVEIFRKLFPSLASSRSFWIERSERIARARRESQTPVNRKVLIQDLLIPWLEVCQK